MWRRPHGNKYLQNKIKKISICLICCFIWKWYLGVFDDVAKKKDVRLWIWQENYRERQSNRGGAKKRNKCLNYVGGRGRKSEWANIFVFIPLWKTWSHLKVFTAGINLRDVSSPSARVASRSGPVAKETSAGHCPACYFRATDNTPPPRPAISESG